MKAFCIKQKLTCVLSPFSSEYVIEMRLLERLLRRWFASVGSAVVSLLLLLAERQTAERRKTDEKTTDTLPAKVFAKLCVSSNGELLPF